MNNYDRRIVENLKRKRTSNDFYDENKKGKFNLKYQMNDRLFALLFLVILFVLIFLLF
ncbi:MAG: hypothetical protein ACP5OZ_00630 [Candidatus Woesearchaeota archaeon]